MAWLTKPPLRFEQFGTPLTGFLIAAVIGIAAALASADDAGRRELIGLAASAHLTVLPAWLGIALVFGLPEAKTVSERLLSFVTAVGTLTAAAWISFVLLGMRGDRLRRYVHR